MIHMKVKPFLHVNHNVWFLFIVVFLNESRETAWEMYLPLLCHWGWKRRHEWTQDLYFCANNSKKWGPELVKRGPERTQDLYSGLYSEKGRSWVSEKRSRADSGPLFWTLQWKREVLSLWKELLRVSHFLKLLHQKPPLFLHHGEQCVLLAIASRSGELVVLSDHYCDQVSISIKLTTHKINYCWKLTIIELCFKWEDFLRFPDLYSFFPQNRTLNCMIVTRKVDAKHHKQSNTICLS